MPQQGAILIGDNRTAASRHDQPVTLHQIFERSRFALAKPHFTLDIENMRNRHAGAKLDFLIAIHKILAQMLCQHAPHGGLARAHHAHQNQISGLEFALAIAV